MYHNSRKKSMSNTKDKVIDDYNNRIENADFSDLTPQAEINRLKKVLEEKNNQITDFKRYDEDRKIYIRRLEKQVVTLRNKNQQLNKRVNQQHGHTH